ncbi:MAG: DUF2207 domain-containing protein [Candidatus Portnoybacteria bacterium]|nr:DUF2207 domain-containing protein [Candidatus Portnoybacteria bacterium]
MKKLSIFSVLFIGLFFAFSVCAQEKIDDFAATIKINTDSSINVSERIEYDFGTQEKHGIFRFIPIKYKARGGNYNLRISDISVNDENNFAYPFKKSPSGNSIEIKIGDADKLISGKKIYTINYKINRAINYFDDYDELYWNVTGNEWGILIEKSFAKIILPIPLKPEEIKKECFAGDFSSVDKCSAIQFGNNNDNGLINSVNFSETKSLNPGEGLTIVVGWPKDIVAKPSTTQNISYIIKDNLILAFPLIVFFILFYVWFRLGRDPRGRGTIIAQYEAPMTKIFLLKLCIWPQKDI